MDRQGGVRSLGYAERVWGGEEEVRSTSGVWVSVAIPPHTHTHCVLPKTVVEFML